MGRLALLTFVKTVMFREGESVNDETPYPTTGTTFEVRLSHVALGPDYPPALVSAEIGRVAVAAARVDQELALLLQALHAGRRSDWKFDELRRKPSSRLKDLALQRVEEFFEGPMLKDSTASIEAAWSALDHRHVVMHTVWTLRGPDAMTPVAEVLAALEAPDPDAALAELKGRDVDSEDWETAHPRSGGPGLKSITELREVRKQLEQAQRWLEERRFTLASALYCGTPVGALRVLDLDSGDELITPSAPSVGNS